MNKFITVLAFLIIATSLNEVSAQVDSKDTYICPPCGCSMDNREFKEKGTCPTCSMALLNKSNLNDGLNYKNIYIQDVCDKIAKNPKILLLDVRSVEEYNGTTSDLGRFKNAINIPIADIEIRVDELKNYKNKEIIVYCSISARSARVSDYLSKNGFVNVNNMMGGLTVWNNTAPDSLSCKNILLEQP